MPFPPCPQPPDWSIDWEALDRFDWLRDLRGVPQDPVRHAEGDVWTHVHMVCEAMAVSPEWRALPESDRSVLFAASLLHDVAKAYCTRVEPDGKVSSRGHAWKGAIRARFILWRRHVPFVLREQVAALIRHHLVPLYLADSSDPVRLAIEVSQTARCDLLAILAECDARGRICPDPERLFGQIHLFRDTCSALGCLDRPYSFPSDQSRFRYFLPTREVSAMPDRPGPTVVVLSGLPSAGKDHWARENLPGVEVITPDLSRDRMAVGAGNRGRSEMGLERSRGLAGALLAEGRPVIWNATHLSRQARAEAVRFFANLNARIRIVYVEVPYERLIDQNRSRKRRVPERVIERMFDRWEVPDRSEAHQVEWVVREGI